MAFPNMPYTPSVAYSANPKTIGPSGPYDSRLPSKRLLNVSLPVQHIPLFRRVNSRVEKLMSSATFDASHDYEHIQRVVQNAYNIYMDELFTDPFIAHSIDPLVIYLSCLVHDVADHKYIQDDENAELITENLLLSCGASADLARKVRIIATNVSYSHESRNRALVQQIVEEHPELAIVQDADRLDALGWVGQARTFVHHGASVKFRNESLHVSMRYHWEKLSEFPMLMKTKFGRREGQNRWEWMLKTREQWLRDTDVSDVVSDEDVSDYDEGIDEDISREGYIWVTGEVREI